MHPKRLMRRAVLAFSVRSRQKKARAIGAFLAQRKPTTAVLVGVGSGREANEMIVERAIEQHARIVGAMDLWEGVRPAWPYMVADGRQMPLRDQGCDFILSSAVIEHVGGVEEQQSFVAEHLRVGRCWAITTPNRWFPVESHTSAMFKHWSPAWRARRSEFTRLLSRSEFRDLLPPGTQIVGRPWSATFTALGVS